VYAAARHRPDPVETIEAQNRTRVQSLVPVRMARMLASPFAFLRGAAPIMAADVAGSPVTGLTVQACGDMHVGNFGVFASAERNLVFSINDFDESLPAPWEWDLRRLTASAAVAARHLEGDRADAERAARAASRAYREHMREYAEMGYLDTWYASIRVQDVLALLSKQLRKDAKAIVSKARKQTNLQLLGRLTDVVDDRQQIVEHPPLIVRETTAEDGRPIAPVIDAFLQSYVESLAWERRRLIARYRILDVARKVVGVGSVGMHCWIALLQGLDTQDPLFLQVKEAQASALQPYVALKAPFDSEGQRVVVGQRLIQGSPDIFLGWGTVHGMPFYVRQLRDMKGGVEIEPGEMDMSSFVAYCALCGWALALAHAKSGDPAAIAGYVGKSEALDEAMAAFALAYAGQTERDHEALAEAAKAGRIPVARSDAKDDGG
jgi:uncharacterized protein (DUF2252 family)